MNTESKKGGNPSRELLYAEAAKHAPRAIERLVELMEHKNENVAVAAIKIILAKAIPDLKSMEIKGDLNTNLTLTNLTDEQLDKLINAKIGQVGVGGIASGEGSQNEGNPS